jgi:hypothetical protein
MWIQTFSGQAFDLLSIDTIEKRKEGDEDERPNR